MKSPHPFVRMTTHGENTDFPIYEVRRDDRHRVRELADGIIEAQVREIGEMKRLILELEARPTPAGAPDLEPAAAK